MKPTIESVTISHNHYGKSVGFDVHEYESGKPGPHVYLQASVHGAELQGNLVIEELIKLLNRTPWQGKVTIVPFANPWSAHSHFGAGTYGRFDMMTGRNWNRQYHDLADKDLCRELLKTTTPEDPDFKEQYRALLSEQLERLNANRHVYGFQRGHRLTYELQKRSLHADIVLDLHTAPIAGLYVYAPEYFQQRVRELSIPVNIIIPNVFDGAGDEAHVVPWLTLKSVCDEMDIPFEVPVESYTIELGGEEIISRELAKKQLNHIANYLYQRGLFTENPCQVELPEGYYQYLKHYKAYFADRACLCDYQVKPGSYVKEGDVLAILSVKQLTGEVIEQPMTAVVEGIVVNHASTSNLEAGSQVFQVLEKPKKYSE